MFVSQYAYSAIQYVSGSQVHPAQILFGVLYIINLGIMLYIYVKIDVFQGQAGSDVYMSFVASVISALKMLQVYNNMVLPLKPIDVSVHVASDEKKVVQRWSCYRMVYNDCVTYLQAFCFVYGEV